MKHQGCRDLLGYQGAKATLEVQEPRRDRPLLMSVSGAALGTQL